MAVNKIEQELEARSIETIDDLNFPMFRADQIKYFRELRTLYQRDRLGLRPEEKEFHTYQLQFNSLLSMEQVLTYLLDMQENYHKRQIINPINPSDDEVEMMNYFKSGVQEDNNSF